MTHNHSYQPLLIAAAIMLLIMSTSQSLLAKSTKKTENTSPKTSLMLSTGIYGNSSENSAFPLFGIGINRHHQNQDIYFSLVSSIISVNESGGSYYYYQNSGSMVAGLQIGTRFLNDRFFIDLHSSVLSLPKSTGIDINAGIGTQIGIMKPSISINFLHKFSDTTNEPDGVGLNLKADFVF